MNPFKFNKTKKGVWKNYKPKWAIEREMFVNMIVASQSSSNKKVQE